MTEKSSKVGKLWEHTGGRESLPGRKQEAAHVVVSSQLASAADWTRSELCHRRHDSTSAAEWKMIQPNSVMLEFNCL